MLNIYLLKICTIAAKSLKKSVQGQGGGRETDGRGEVRGLDGEGPLHLHPLWGPRVCHHPRTGDRHSTNILLEGGLIGLILVCGFAPFLAPIFAPYLPCLYHFYFVLYSFFCSLPSISVQFLLPILLFFCSLPSMSLPFILPTLL